MDISPKYMMSLVKDIESKPWSEYSSHKIVEVYIKKWINIEYDYHQNEYANFDIVRKKMIILTYLIPFMLYLKMLLSK